MFSPAKIVRSVSRELGKLRHALLMRRRRGVIHVGANSGQERDRYASYGLDVLWIEPIPAVFEALQRNIQGYPRQRALQYLVTDRDGETRTLQIASNAGASSSIFDFAQHRDVWPSVRVVDKVELPTVTLDTIVERERIDLARYDALILDTQGAELLVLKGATKTLPHMALVKVEVADFDSYAGCPRPEDIESFLKPFGFRETLRRAFATHPSGGQYFDIVYLRRGQTLTVS